MTRKDHQERGCPFCQDGAVIAWNFCNDAVKIESSGNVWILATGDSEIDISFCPFCGAQLRKISEEPLSLEELFHLPDKAFVWVEPIPPGTRAAGWQEAGAVKQWSDFLRCGKDWQAYRIGSRRGEGKRSGACK